jgi:hypothetical protein
MEIAGVLTAGKFLSSALEQLGKPSQPQVAAHGRPAETPATPGGPGDATPLLREILARYDVTNISPREFSEMIRDLHEAGALTGEEFQELSLIRVDLDLQQVDPDETLDLVDFYLDKLVELRRSLDDFESGADRLADSQPSQVASVERRLRWLEKLAAIHTGTDAAGLDALA